MTITTQQQIEQQFKQLGQFHARDFIDISKLDLPDSQMKQLCQTLKDCLDKQHKQLSALHDQSSEKIRHLSDKRQNLFLNKMLDIYEKFKYAD